MDVITKICSKCGKEKNLDEFNKQKLGKYGRRASCRECQNAENREYKQTEKGIELRRKWKKSEVGKACSKRYREKHKTTTREYCRWKPIKEKKKRNTDKQRFSGNRIKALERDNYRCVLCGSDYMLQVHHKDETGRNKPKELRNDNLDNLITLCVRCHINQHNPVLKRWNNKKREEVVE